MTTPTVHPYTTVTLDGGEPVQVQDGTVTLASGVVPYARATVVLPLTADTALDDLDPRDDHRVLINGGNIGHWEEIPAGYGFGHGPFGHGPFGGTS